MIWLSETKPASTIFGKSWLRWPVYYWEYAKGIKPCKFINCWPKWHYITIVMFSQNLLHTPNNSIHPSPAGGFADKRDALQISRQVPIPLHFLHPETPPEASEKGQAPTLVRVFKKAFSFIGHDNISGLKRRQNETLYFTVFPAFIQYLCVD